jgi:hypothetical protein
MRIGNIDVYNDDEEIIEILQKTPALAEYDNMNILRFMETKTVGADFGTVILDNSVVYTVYKFDNKHHKPDDAGLLMTKSNEKFTNEQLAIWQKFKYDGMVFGPKIYQLIENFLIANFSIQQAFNRTTG